VFRMGRYRDLEKRARESVLAILGGVAALDVLRRGCRSCRRRRPK